MRATLKSLIMFTNMLPNVYLSPQEKEALPFPEKTVKCIHLAPKQIRRETVSLKKLSSFLEVMVLIFRLKTMFQNNESRFNSKS